MVGIQSVLTLALWLAQGSLRMLQARGIVEAWVTLEWRTYTLAGCLLRTGRIQHNSLSPRRR